MSDAGTIKPALLALCAQLGTVIQEGDLTKSRPIWVIRPMGDDEDDLWFTVWVEAPRVRDGAEPRDDAAPEIRVSGIVSAVPMRRIDPHVRSWMLLRNVQHRALTIAARRASRPMNEPPTQHLWATGSVPIEGSVDGLRVAVGGVISEIEATAREGRFRIRQAESKSMAAQRKEREEQSSATETRAPKAPPAVDLADVMAELDAMTGLVEVKCLVRSLVDQHRFAELRSVRGLRNAAMSPNLVFTGNPGTGKTTVARIVAQAYRAIGLLPKGHLIEVDRGDLVAKYVGQTAPKTKDVCKKALGGVLFIDEAYSLDRDGSVDYGSESVEALMTFMESHRGQLAVIVAGYPREMAAFLRMNPGLRSRFDTTVHFPDFDDAELVEILVGMFRAHDYVIPGATRERIEAFVGSLPHGRGFGNARDMRTLFGDIVRRHAQMVMASDSPATTKSLTAIEAAAVPPPVEIPDPDASQAGGVYL